jgi:hypothetical protein
VGEVTPVKLQLALDLAAALNSAQEAMSMESNSDGLLAASKAILQLVWPGIAAAKGPSDIHWCLQLCALAVQFLCLGFLSYTQAHIGPVQPFFLDTPMQRLTLLGLERERHNSHLVVELVELTCLGRMTRGPVLIFYPGQDSADGQISKTQPNPKIPKCDIRGHVDDILDTWGPGNLVFQTKEADTPVGIRIVGGVYRSARWWKIPLGSENGRHLDTEGH